MRSSLISVVLGVLLSFATGGPSAAQADASKSLSGVVPKRVVNQLRSLATAFARKKHTPTAEALVAMCETAGLDAPLVERLRKDVDKAAARAKRPATNLRSEVAKARSIAKQLTTAIAKVDDEAKKKALAALILRLDGESVGARKVLGHEKHGAVWRSPSEQAAWQRRREIQAKLASARKLDVPLATADSAHPVFQALERPAVAVTYRGFTFHSDLGAARTESVVRSALRASAVSSWLRGGAFEIQPALAGSSGLIIERKVDYDRVLDLFVKRGVLTAAQAKESAGHAWFYPARAFAGVDQPIRFVRRYSSFGGTFAYLMFDLSVGGWARRGTKEVQACLHAGHLNWVCLAYLGSSLPPIYETRSAKHSGKRKYALEGDGTVSWESMKKLIGAGLLGNRSWLRHLATKRVDPAWADAMVEGLADLKADDILKSTFVAEYLHETGEMGALMAKSARAPNDDPRKTLLAALGESLPSFESRWRAWLVGATGGGIVQRFERKPRRTTPVPAHARQALAHLNRIRDVAVERMNDGCPASLDEELSAGALAHAKYLNLNPAQAAAWPDAHEEYEERKGFSPPGSWAGAHAVIAPGARSPEHAIDGWMATFYHRLPLIDPGLIRIGWGFEDGMAVLDCVSMVDPGRVACWVKWPADGARNVPVAFAPELPNPVPGADQSGFGYPITIQHFSTLETEAVPRMRLYEGSAPTGAPVPCHLSTPGRPTNPELVPAGASCLIPKAHLRAKTKYVVVAETEAGETFTWRFTTR